MIEEDEKWVPVDLAFVRRLIKQLKKIDSVPLERCVFKKIDGSQGEAIVSCYFISGEYITTFLYITTFKQMLFGYSK